MSSQPIVPWGRAVGLVLVLLAAGCREKGPPLVPVTGSVTESGRPLAGALVMFIPENGSPSGAKTDVQGRFELRFGDGRRGALSGRHTVNISLPNDATPPPTGDVTPLTPPKPSGEFRKQAEVKTGVANDFAFDVANDASAAR